MTTLQDTLAPGLKSWVESANTAGYDFPIQNLPFGRFKVAGDSAWRIGVAIGDQVLDMYATGLIQTREMNQLIALPRSARESLRVALSRGLAAGSAQAPLWRAMLFAQSEVELGLPCDTHDYTDFYVGIHHATAVGKLFRPDAPLLPNYKWVPIGYHGRASTLNPSGTAFVRPYGQLKGADDPVLAPSQRLDYELELGVIIAQPNAQGVPVSMLQAEDHVFGLTLFNDWSARDIQSWEYQPLGPFLSKNFASTVSPWMVTLEALAPFRKAHTRPAQDPAVLPYLDSEANRNAGAIDVDLEVLLQTTRMREAGQAAVCIAKSNYAEAAYWTLAQMVVHHTVNGCSLAAGDLLGTGTLSGPAPEQAGSLLELSKGGKQTITLPNGETRTFLQDGDEVTIRGLCKREGFVPIGFGACTARVLPARVL